jgi:hypothetical protein
MLLLIHCTLSADGKTSTLLTRENPVAFPTSHPASVTAWVPQRCSSMLSSWVGSFGLTTAAQHPPGGLPHLAGCALPPIHAAGVKSEWEFFLIGALGLRRPGQGMAGCAPVPALKRKSRARWFS